MKKSARHLLIMLLLSLCMIASYAYSASERVVYEEVVAKNKLEMVVTRGNWSYVPLDLDDVADSNHLIILAVLDGFEKKYENLRIINWQIDSKGVSRFSSAHTYGIWIQTERK